MLTNIRFVFKQANGRVYKIGKRLIEISKKAVDKIIEWNDGPMRNDVEHDRKICRSLLLSLVAKDDLCAAKVNDDVKRFIKGIAFFFQIHFIDSITTKTI